MLILCCSFVSAEETRNFTNNLNEENLTFTGDQNITRLLKIPRFTNVTFANMELKNINFSYNNILDSEVNYSTNTSDFMNDYNLVRDYNYSSFGYLDEGSGNNFRSWQQEYPYTNGTNVTIEYKYQYSIFEDEARFVLSCWSGSWTEIHSNIKSQPSSDATTYQATIDVPEACEINPVKFKVDYRLSVPSGGAFLRIYELNLSQYNKSINSYVKIGTPTATKDFDNPLFSEPAQQFSFNTKLNSMANSCTCLDCLIDDRYCSIPFLFHSDTAGILEYSSLLVNTSLNSSLLTVNVLDSDTTSAITVNMTIQLIGEIQNQSTTVIGQSSFTIPFNTTTAQEYSVRVFETSGSDYSIVVREVEISQGANTVLNIYLTNTSDTATTNIVTYRVVDQDRNRIEGATVHILKQDPATNTFITISDLVTNPHGEVSTTLIIDTIFYKVLVDFEGSRVFTQNAPTAISANDITIILNINLESGFSGYYDTAIIDSNVGLSFIDSDNTSGYFEATVSGLSVVETCLKVYKINASGETFLEQSCQNSSTTTLQSSIINVTNITTLRGDVLIDKKDGYGFVFIKSLNKVIGVLYAKSLGIDTLFFPILGTVFALFGFLTSPVLGLLMLIFIMAAIYLSHITFMQPGALMLIISLAVFSLITFVRRRR